MQTSLGCMGCCHMQTTRLTLGIALGGQAVLMPAPRSGRGPQRRCTFRLFVLKADSSCFAQYPTLRSAYTRSPRCMCEPVKPTMMPYTSPSTKIETSLGTWQRHGAWLRRSCMLLNSRLRCLPPARREATSSPWPS